MQSPFLDKSGDCIFYFHQINLVLPQGKSRISFNKNLLLPAKINQLLRLEANMGDTKSLNQSLTILS